MKLKYKAYIICILLLIVTAISSYGLSSPYLGYWENVDGNTRGITSFYLNPGLEKNELDIHVFAACSPKDCDWDHTPLYTYGTNVDDKTHEFATAVYTTNFSVTALSLQFMYDGRILLDSYTRFTDNSNRQNYHSYDIFVKVSNQIEEIKPKCADLIIEKIHPFKIDKGDNQITVLVEIKNIGNIESGYSVARLSDTMNKAPAGIEYESFEKVKSLAPGESTTVSFTIRYKGKFSPKLSVEAEADYQKQVNECDENNNKKTFRN